MHQSKPWSWEELGSFVEVARSGSLSEAARRLGLERSTLSRRLASLEHALKQQLFRRSTRTMVLTEEGARLLRASEPAFRGLEEELRRWVSGSGSEVQGRVRITAPVILARDLLAVPLAKMTSRYPKVEYEVILDDRVLDLTAERIDIAIRGGKSRLPSGARAYPLGTSDFRLYASPDYLKRRGTPRSPKELSSHAGLVYAPGGDPFRWTLVKGAQRVQVEVGEAVRASTLDFLRDLAREGAGIALLPSVLVSDNVIAGELVPVLSSWAAERSQSTLIVPQPRQMSLAVAKTLEALREHHRPPNPSGIKA